MFQRLAFVKCLLATVRYAVWDRDLFDVGFAEALGPNVLEALRQLNGGERGALVKCPFVKALQLRACGDDNCLQAFALLKCTAVNMRDTSRDSYL